MDNLQPAFCAHSMFVSHEVVKHMHMFPETQLNNGVLHDTTCSNHLLLEMEREWRVDRRANTAWPWHEKLPLDPLDFRIEDGKSRKGMSQSNNGLLVLVHQRLAFSDGRFTE